MDDSDKAMILAAIRSAAVPATEPPPPIPVTAGVTADADTFAAALRTAAGECHTVNAHSGLAVAVATRHPDAVAIFSTVAAVPGTVTPPPDAAPHGVATVDVAVVAGEFGVCENGAVWVSTMVDLPPAVLFLTQHLVLVLARTALVPTMHDAYARLDAAGPMPDFGVFIAGPSKTADIEQCLVIGAHGPRSLTVLLTD